MVDAGFGQMVVKVWVDNGLREECIRLRKSCKETRINTWIRLV